MISAPELTALAAIAIVGAILAPIALAMMTLLYH